MGDGGIIAAGAAAGEVSGWHILEYGSRDHAASTGRREKAGGWSRTIALTREGVSPAALPRHLELLASVHFLLRTRQADVTDVAGLRTILLRNEKDFSEYEIRQAIKELRQHDLCPPVESR